jgi:uncharacterized protein
MDINVKLAKEFGLRSGQVEKTIQLIDEGNTVPFIARYRKEVTGGLTDVTLRELDERLAYLRNLETRKEEVLKLIDEQGKLTEDLKNEIEKAEVLQRVEDLYKPYKKKKATRASKARERGLEPLAMLMGTDAEKVMYTGADGYHTWCLSYLDGRRAYCNVCAEEPGFTTRIVHKDRVETVAIDDAFFDAFIASLVEFFRTGKVPVEPGPTVRIMKLRERCLQAMQTPDEWIGID